jgi:uncharacterized protein
MSFIKLTKNQARQFILVKQGLIGAYKFHDKEGILEFVRQAGCVQYDPIDVCGKNAELTLQSRINGFTKQMLYELLYEDRCLVDYFDKNLAIIDSCDWKYFERIREAHRQCGRGYAEVNEVADKIKAIIAEKGPVCSKDLEFAEKVDWYWSSTKLSRAALETLYFRGELIVHHKKGTIKYYALTEDYMPKEIIGVEDPFKDELEHMKWRVLRRISAVGMLWNKPSDAWLCIWNMKSKERNQIFSELLAENKILEIEVEDSKAKFYCLENDRWIIDEVQKGPKLKHRTELIAPLDSFLWDRKLIKELFDFDYKWEIYTPIEQRKYGYYVLPILSGERFVGRTEVICDRKTSTLSIKNIWFEADVKVTKKLRNDMKGCYERFRRFHGLKEMIYSEATGFIDR